MSSYLAVTGGDVERALVWHRWNTAISAVFYEDLQALEVALRNTLHQGLTHWSFTTAGDGNWTNHLPGALAGPGGRVLTQEAIQDLEDARRRATANGRTATTGRIVAELSFGFWVALRPHQG